MIKPLKITFIIILFLFGCKTIKVRQNSLNNLITGKWDFIKAIDSFGIEHNIIREGNWGSHSYKVIGSNVEFKPNNICIRDYGKNNFTICKWKIKNDSMFQYGGQFDSISYNKKFEDFTQKISKLSTDILILELKPNMFFEYKKEKPKLIK